MFVEQILVIKETSVGECRVALIPESVAFLISKGYRVLVESNAGANAGYMDLDYIQVGANIVSLTSARILPHTLILRVKRANEQQELTEAKLFCENTAIFGFLDPLFQEPLGKGAYMDAWLKTKVNTFSVGLFKSLTIQDPKNLQAAMSRIAGRLTFEDAKKRYLGRDKIKLTVIGSGPAALTAAIEARKQGVTVQLFARREHYRDECESLGISYYVVPSYENPARFIKDYLYDQTIVITAARTVGEKAPIYIDECNLSILPKNTIIIDLAIGDGGNVTGTKRDQVVSKNGVSIVSVSAYPKAVPKEASVTYSKCMVHLILEVISEKRELLFDHPLLQEAWVTRGGKCNVFLFESFSQVNSKKSTSKL